MTVPKTPRPPEEKTGNSQRTPESEGSDDAGKHPTSPAKDDATTIPVISAVAIRITPEKHGYEVAVLEKGSVVYTKYTRSAPWLSDQIQREIVNASHPKLNPDNRPDKNRYKVAMLSCFAELDRALEHDPEQKRSLSSIIVAGIIKRTQNVQVYPGEATFLEVQIDDKNLCFTSKEIAHQNATTLNEKYFNEFYLPLDANSKEWKEIRNYWSEIGTVEETATETDMDVLIEHLADHLASRVFVYSNIDRIDRPDVGYYDEEHREVWIPSTIISSFLDRLGASDKRAELAKELKRRDITIGNSHKKRFRNLPSGQKRYWRFNETFVRFRIDQMGPGPELIDTLFGTEAPFYDTRA